MLPKSRSIFNWDTIRRLPHLMQVWDAPALDSPPFSLSTLRVFVIALTELQLWTIRAITIPSQFNIVSETEL